VRGGDGNGTPRFLLHADADWYVVDKPTHLSTHGAWVGDLALVEWLALHRGEALHVCSRLDKGTSGVLVFARTPEASARAQRIHENETALKRYVFFSISDSLDIDGRREWIDDSPIEGKPARTSFRRLERSGGTVFYEALIARGRTHQIRVHASRARVPLLGDDEYGGAPFSRLMLHCSETRWPRGGSADGSADGSVTQGEPWTWRAPLPASFEALRATGDEQEAALACARDRRLDYPSSVTQAWRAVHRDEAPFPGLPGAFALDVYGSWLCLWWYGEPLLAGSHEARIRDEGARAFCSLLGARGCVIREVNRNAHKVGLVSGGAVVGESPPAEFEVEELGARYVVSLTERQHLGLFLDQRDNRARLARLAPGARVANLFSYSCSFSVAAARAGCEVVFSVDAAESALALGKRNFELNGLAAARRGKFVAEDVRAFLDRQRRKAERDGRGALFDLVVCDPPVFSSTREKGAFHVAQAWRELVEGCEALLAPGGTAFFSTNHRAGEEATYQAVLQEAFPDVLKLAPPLDFPEPGRKGAAHVKMFLCRKMG
jgi:23S rRNA G2069 N7-methylase RlmK/C1962 C5-methylase RlmI